MSLLDGIDCGGGGMDKGVHDKRRDTDFVFAFVVVVELPAFDDDYNCQT